MLTLFTKRAADVVSVRLISFRPFNGTISQLKTIALRHLSLQVASNLILTLPVVIQHVFPNALTLEVDDCARDPCVNGASCTDGSNSRTCTCANGWTGNSCESSKHRICLNSCLEN